MGTFRAYLVVMDFKEDCSGVFQDFNFKKTAYNSEENHNKT